MSDDARRKIWLMHKAAEEIDRLRMALHMVLSTGDLEPNRPLEDCRRYAKDALGL